MNSGAMFVLSAGSRLLSQQEPQSFPVDVFSSFGPVFHHFFVVFNFKRGNFQTINLRNDLNMEYDTIYE